MSSTTPHRGPLPTGRGDRVRRDSGDIFPADPVERVEHELAVSSLSPRTAAEVAAHHGVDRHDRLEHVGHSHLVDDEYDDDIVDVDRDVAVADDRGRHADRPSEIPKRGLWDVLVRVKNEFKNDNLGIVSGGVAFFAFLAIFPALAALISLWALVADPATIESQIGTVMSIIPPSAQQLIAGQLREIAASSSSSLGWGVAAGVLVSLWSANKGMSSMIKALNIAYDEDEDRGFFKVTALSLGLTFATVLGVLFIMAMIVVAPYILQRFGFGGSLVDQVFTWARWPVLALFVMGAISTLYHYAPSRHRPRWRWVSWGAALATVLWLAVSAGFSFYVSEFGSYNETYGSVGAVVVLLLWFQLSALSILIGAELNSELERQTLRDSTEDGDQPIGQRDAWVADHAGELH